MDFTRDQLTRLTIAFAKAADFTNGRDREIYDRLRAELRRREALERADNMREQTA